MRWDCHRPPGATYETRTPQIWGNYLGIRAERFGEGSVIVSCVELSRDRQAIAELYVWLGCDHDHKGEKRGNCYHVYTCSKCGDRYEIDSGD